MHRQLGKSMFCDGGTLWLPKMFFGYISYKSIQIIYQSILFYIIRSKANMKTSFAVGNNQNYIFFQQIANLSPHHSPLKVVPELIFRYKSTKFHDKKVIKQNLESYYDL